MKDGTSSYSQALTGASRPWISRILTGGGKRRGQGGLGARRAEGGSVNVDGVPEGTLTSGGPGLSKEDDVTPGKGRDPSGLRIQEKPGKFWVNWWMEMSRGS